MSKILEDPRAEDAAALETPIIDENPEGEATRTPTKVRSAEELMAGEEERPLTREEVFRPSFGAMSTSIGAAFLVGGMFVGYAPRAFAIFGALVGIGASIFAALPSKKPTLRLSLAFGMILLAGFLGLAVTGGLSGFVEQIKEAVTEARLRRPPAAFDPGWGGIVPWTCALMSFSAAWIGSVGRKAAVGVLIPIPIIAFAAIAQPAELQIISGIVAFASFVIGLAVIYRADRGEGDGVSLKYEIRRAIKMLPLLLVLTGALAGLSQAGFLFPDPVYDPTERAQKPKSTPLSEVEDRVLFSVDTPEDSPFTGPWRQGVLDIMDPEGFWRLPPFSSSTLQDAPPDGIIGDEFGFVAPAESRASIRVRDLGGTVLPMPSRVQGIRVVRGPKLQLDPRTQRVLVKEGQVGNNLDFEVNFALLPKVSLLRNAPGIQDPTFLEEFTDTAGLDPPPSVVALIEEARQKADNLWDELDYVRSEYLETIEAAGPGLPAPVNPERIEDMFSGEKKATPYELVATQAVLARWLGVPARIGYGFDGGEEGDQVTTRDYRPKHGSSWLEVYFEGAGWFPVTGLPARAQQSLTPGEQNNQIILPNDEIAVSVYVPLRIKPSNFLLAQIQGGVLVAIPFVLLGVIIYFTVPVVRKIRRRGRRKDWALKTGRAERIAVAYADVRDLATDLGVGDPYSTPLGYLSKVVSDEEHRELAWLVTRTLFGDLSDKITDAEVLAAEELSRSLRRRLSEAQPFTIRGVALVSRLSLRNPYAPELLSPPIEKFSVRKLLKLDHPKKRPGFKTKRSFSLPKLPFRHKEERPNDVVT